MEDRKDMTLPKCKKCGNYVPPGKDLCWLCEHDSKLHKPEEECEDTGGQTHD